MIALDTNVIIHMLVEEMPGHARAAQWLGATKEGLATTHVTVGEILRLLTHPRVFRYPMSLKNAIDLLNHFIREFDVTLLEESLEWWLELRELNATIRGNEVFDARIALCLRHNGIKQICTLDQNFSKYSFLEIVVF